MYVNMCLLHCEIIVGLTHLIGKYPLLSNTVYKLQIQKYLLCHWQMQKVSKKTW